MAEINKPGDISKIWAIIGDVVEPPDVKKDTGWTAGEIPARQYFNWLDNKQDQFIAHVNQHGLPVWDSETEYQAYASYVQAIGNGNTYICVQTHIDQDPNLDDGTYWRLAFAPINSPAFTGEPRGTTPLVTDDSTRLATTEWVVDYTATLVAPAAVRRPVNVTPADASSGISATPTLTANAYYSLYGVAQASAQFQVSTDSTFTSTVVNATVGAVNTYNVVTTLSGINYWRVRYTDSEGAVSEWSVPTQFTTAAISVNTPSITSPANNATGIDSNPTIVASAFAVTGGSDTHLSTDWEIRTAPNGGGAIQYSSYNNTTNKTSFVVPPTNSLSANTVYYIRARYRGTTYGYSAWTENKITTLAAFYPTVIGQSFGGGYYVGKIAFGGNTYAIIVAPKASGENSNVQFRNVLGGELSVSATNSYDGAYNSAVLNTSVHPAAQWAEALSIGGYTDWYLPSLQELQLAYRNFKPTSDLPAVANNQSPPTGYSPNAVPVYPGYAQQPITTTTVTAFQDGNSEAFIAQLTNGYWNSTIIAAGTSTQGHAISFVNGASTGGAGFSETRFQYARAFRRVQVPN